MAVPAAQGRLLQNLLRQDLAKGDDDVDISPERGELLLAVGLLTDPLGREDGQTQLNGPGFDRGGHQRFPGSASPVRLGDHTDQLIVALHQLIKAERHRPGLPKKQSSFLIILRRSSGNS